MQDDKNHWRRALVSPRRPPTPGSGSEAGMGPGDVAWERAPLTRALRRPPGRTASAKSKVLSPPAPLCAWEAAGAGAGVGTRHPGAPRCVPPARMAFWKRDVAFAPKPPLSPSPAYLDDTPTLRRSRQAHVPRTLEQRGAGGPEGFGVTAHRDPHPRPSPGTAWGRCGCEAPDVRLGMGGAGPTAKTRVNADPALQTRVALGSTV